MVIANVLCVFALICAAYGLICICYAGIGAAFNWFWLTSSLILFLLAFILRYINRKEWHFSREITTGISWLFLLMLVLFMGVECLILRYANHDTDQEVAYIIVLGARVDGTRVTGCLQRRLDMAITYMNENPNTIAIVSGGQGEGEAITEAEAMQQYMVQRGIEKDRIRKEEQSRNTYENIQYSRKIMKDDQANVAIITNGFHVYRALCIAKKQGITQVKGIAASTDPVMAVSYYVREAFAVMKGIITGTM